MKKFLSVFSLILVLVFTISIFIMPSEKIMAKSDLPEQAQKRLANAIVLYVGSNDAYINNVKTNVDENIEICPAAENGRTLVPVRFISEALGAKVDWQAKTSTVTITYKGKKISLVLGQKLINANGKKISLEVSAKQINNRTFVPFRAIAEAFGKKVFYDRGLIIISDKDNLFNAKAEKTLLDGIISKVNNLPTVGSEAKLKEILEKFRASHSSDNRLYKLDMMATSTTQAAAKTMNAKEESKGSSDYSKTNVQVEGVDESDIVKTDGKYIYQVNKQRIVVADVYPADKMKVESIIQFTDSNFSPSEIYVDGDKMVVIGSTYREINCKKTSSIKADDCYMPSYSPTFVKAIVYDITDKSNIKKVKDFAIEGNIISSRKIGQSLYIVTNKYVDYYYFQQNIKENLTPIFYDSALKGGEETNLGCSKIRCIPHCVTPNYMIISAINLDKIDEPANIQSYLGSGEQIYVSENNLYVAVSEYENDTVEKAASGAAKIAPPYWNRNLNTAVYKFSLDKGNVTYIAKGSVPGTILNQFSMDEFDGNFRIATTVGHVSRNNSTSMNNLYVLNDAMSQIGKIEDIAPGERIYSVRFMGKKAYMVTFKKVDPLFVIDLAKPSEPKILGKLKIPGYSDYLHPYDENHIIGFGKDTIEAKEGTFAWYQGLKVAMFDVTDVNNPKEMFKEIIGDRGTDSELLYNHKALLFSKEKSLMAFPVTLMEIKDKNKKMNDNGYPEYGEFAFQGAYVYNVDLKNGFQLKARISHMSDDEYQKAGSYWYNSDNSVERMLYISNTLYTLSKGMIKAHDLTSLKEIGSLGIK